VQSFAGTTLGAGINTLNIAKGASAASATLNLGALTTSVGSVTTINPGTAWATGVLPTAEKIYVSSITGKTLPGSSGTANWINVNAGLFYRQSASAGAARWVSVDNLGQLAALPATIAAQGTSGTVTVARQISTANITLTGNANSYGLVINSTDAARTLNLGTGGYTYTINGILGINTNKAIIAPGTGGTLVIGSERNLVINIDNTGGVDINAPIVNNGGGASAVTIASTIPSGTPGAVSFGGANTYTGATAITRGTLSFTNASPFGTTPGVNGTSGISINAGSVLSSARTGTNPSTTIAAPIILGAGGNTTLRIGQGAANNTHTFNLNGAIGGETDNLVFTTTTGSFSNGSSVFVLGAASTYTGNTLITTGNGGNNPVFLKAGTGVVDALPATTVLTFDSTVGGGTGRNFQYDMNGNNQTLAGLNNGGNAPQLRRQIFTNLGALATLTINNTDDYTFGGAYLNTANSATTRAQITGNIALTKSGPGTFTLGGALVNGATAGGNTHTGDTTVLGGILVLGEALSLQNSAFDTAGSITGDAANGLRVGIGGTGVASLTLGGLTGDKNFADVFTSTAGGYAGLTALTLNPGAGDTHSYAADIGNGAGNLSLTKTGAGTQVLSGTNTYTGATTGSAGALIAATAAALPGYNVAGKVIFNGGTIGVQVGGGGWASGDVDTLLTNATQTSGALGIDTTNGNLTQWTPFTTTNFGPLGLNKLGANDLNLDQANTFTGPTTVTAGTLTLAHANALQNSPLATTGAGTVNLASGTILTLGGLSGATGDLATVISNYSTVTAINLNTPATLPGAGLSYGGIISDGVPGTTLTKNGSGVQALSGANSYTGATQIDDGILVFRTKAAKAGGTATAAAAGSIGLGVHASDAAFYSAADVDALFNTNSLAGFVLDPASGVAIDTNAASFDQTIALTAARSLTKLGANTLTLSQANTYSGATIVNNGTLSLTGSLDGGGAISTIGTSVFSQTSAGVISGAATFTQGSTGTSILAGTNTYTGVTNVNLGQLTISNAAALGTTDGNTIVAAGGRLAMATAGLSVAEPLAITGTGTTATNGALNFGGGVTGMALTGPITLDGAARIQADGSTGSTLSGGISLGANELTINTDGGATQTINTTAITGTGGSLVKSGGGTLVLAVANSYTGATTVNGGTLSITDNDALGTTDGATTINGGNGTNSVILNLSAATSDLTIAEPLNFFGNTAGRARLSNNSAQNHTLSGPIDVSSDTNLAHFWSDGAGSITVSGDITGTMTNGAWFFVRGNSSSANNRLTGNINLAGTLAKTDGGTWLVGAPGKTYNWTDTVVAVGTLKMGLADALPSATTVIMGNSTGPSTGILDLNGFNQTVGGIIYAGEGVSTGTRTITSATPATLTVDNATDFINTGTGANSVVLTGALSLIKQGAGTLALNGANTHTGATTVAAGTLALSGGGSLANTTGIHLSAAASTFDVSARTGSFTLASSQTLSGSGRVVIDNDSGFVANGTLAPGSSPGTTTVDGAGAFTLGADGNYNWQIHDAAGAAGAGYDTYNLVNGATLDLSLLTSANPYNINLWSLSAVAPDANGNAINFDNTQNYTWTLFSTGTAIGGFSADLFAINPGANNGTNGFTNALDGGFFSVGLEDGDKNLVLNFTAIPEPGAALLGGLGLLALLRRRRKHGLNP
jgi:fibronectin-binding autotransporter adhesin